MLSVISQQSRVKSYEHRKSQTQKHSNLSLQPSEIRSCIKKYKDHSTVTFRELTSFFPHTDPRSVIILSPHHTVSQMIEEIHLWIYFGRCGRHCFYFFFCPLIKRCNKLTIAREIRILILVGPEFGENKKINIKNTLK